MYVWFWPTLFISYLVKDERHSYQMQKQSQAHSPLQLASSAPVLQ